MKSDNKKAEIKTTSQKQTKIEVDNKEYAECVVLRPVGYPFEFNLMDDEIEITNKELFEEYARDQWLGLVVKENSHLFDQKIMRTSSRRLFIAIRSASRLFSTNRVVLDSSADTSRAVLFDASLRYDAKDEGEMPIAEHMFSSVIFLSALNCSALISG